MINYKAALKLYVLKKHNYISDLGFKYWPIDFLKICFDIINKWSNNECKKILNDENGCVFCVYIVDTFKNLNCFRCDFGKEFGVCVAEDSLYSEIPIYNPLVLGSIKKSIKKDVANLIDVHPDGAITIQINLDDDICNKLNKIAEEKTIILEKLIINILEGYFDGKFNN